MWKNDLVNFTTRVRHEHDTNTSATRMEIFDFDNNDTSENIFSHPRISHIANQRLQGEEQFHSENYLSEMPCSHDKCV